MQTVSTARSPARDYANHNFGHEANKTLHFKNVQTTRATTINCLLGFAFGVLVAVLAPNALIAATAERPATVFRRWTIAGEEDAPNVGRHACMIKCGVELVNGVRTECVTYIWSIERDTDSALVDCTVIRDVGEGKARNFAPGGGVKNGRDAHPVIVSCEMAQP